MTTTPTTNNIYLNDYKLNYNPDYKPDYQHLMAKHHGNIMEMTTMMHCYL